MGDGFLELYHLLHLVVYMLRSDDCLAVDYPVQISTVCIATRNQQNVRQGLSVSSRNDLLLGAQLNM